MLTPLLCSDEYKQYAPFAIAILVLDVICGRLLLLLLRWRAFRQMSATYAFRSRWPLLIPASDRNHPYYETVCMFFRLGLVVLDVLLAGNPLLRTYLFGLWAL